MRPPKFISFFVPALLALSLTLVGCDSPQHTADVLQREITDFQTAPTEKKKISIEEHFAKLEKQIAALEKAGHDEEASTLNARRIDLRSDYQAAKMAKALNDAKNAVQGFGEAVKDGADSIGDFFKKSGTTTEK